MAHGGTVHWVDDRIFRIKNKIIKFSSLHSFAFHDSQSWELEILVNVSSHFSDFTMKEKVTS